MYTNVHATSTSSSLGKKYLLNNSVRLLGGTRSLRTNEMGKTKVLYCRRRYV